jgi:hypothetical protein
MAEAFSTSGNIMVPILEAFDSSRIIGWMSIRRDALPAAPNFTFALGYHALAWNAAGAVSRYELVAVSPVLDDNFSAYLESRKET